MTHMSELPETKYCRNCQSDLPVTSFTMNRCNKDGLSFYCAPCGRARVVASRRRRLGPPRNRCGQGPTNVPAGFKWCGECDTIKRIGEFTRNRSQPSGRGSYCKPCYNRIIRENRDKNHGSTRNYHLKHRYGVTADEVDAMIAEQDGLCAICQDAPAEHVDHDHETGRVRGVLCFNCNGALGQFRERSDVMLRAINYLDADREQVASNLGGYELAIFVGVDDDPRPADVPPGIEWTFREPLVN